MHQEVVTPVRFGQPCPPQLSWCALNQRCHQPSAEQSSQPQDRQRWWPLLSPSPCTQGNTQISFKGAILTKQPPRYSTSQPTSRPFFFYHSGKFTRGPFFDVFHSFSQLYPILHSNLPFDHLDKLPSFFFTFYYFPRWGTFQTHIQILFSAALCVIRKPACQSASISNYSPTIVTLILHPN